VGSTRPATGTRRTVEEHQAVVAGLIAETPVERRDLADALDAVLAEDLRATISLPPFDNSAMDGYAVRAADLNGAGTAAPVELPVEQDIPAGRVDVPPLKPGAAHRIMTGAPIPDGADAVVPVERTDRGLHRVRIEMAPEPGDYIRLAGEDATAGTVLIPAGTVLTPPRIGVAAAVGAGTLPVRRVPRALVLSTGSELVAQGTPLRHGQIYESNGPMLAAAVRDAGGEAELLRFVPDDVDAFAATLTGRLPGVDVVITSGGVSAGAYEVVKDALTGRGVEFVSVAMQPGGPQGAGRLDGVPVVTLPGNPVSSQVSFEVFLRPALRAAYGHPHPARPVVRARLSEPLDSPEGRRQFRRGVLDAVDGTVRAVGGPGSHLLSALARADCLIVVPEQVTHAEPGETVEIWLLEG
jgi:molybdopterin molybdotransferase